MVLRKLGEVVQEPRSLLWWKESRRQEGTGVGEGKAHCAEDHGAQPQAAWNLGVGDPRLKKSQAWQSQLSASQAHPRKERPQEGPPMSSDPKEVTVGHTGGSQEK